VLGGALTSVSWRWIFLINIPVGLIVVAAGLRVLPAPQRRAGTRVDLPGPLALTGGLIFLTLAVLRGGVQGWGSAATRHNSGPWPRCWLLSGSARLASAIPSSAISACSSGPGPVRIGSGSQVPT
jgi:hypothetical protein